MSHALLSRDSEQTVLGKGLLPQVNAHPGLSGVVPLQGSLDAFAARMSLIMAAERTLDVQYYIWRDDITGNLLLKALLDAAARGVRVRLLLDDNGVSGLDEKLALLNAEPNIEVRLFNPFPVRWFKPLGFLTEFRRLNRRMHNKSFTADGQVTVVGGRNIGDEYFGATQGVAFADLDVMAVGAVVDQVSQDFDRYWNSKPAYPLQDLVALPGADQSRQLKDAAQQIALSPHAHAYARAVVESHFIENLSAGQLNFEWV
ncbi:MAG: phospholipase D-like domain-containing protein, partial [Burkholderiaceae bacterium]